MNIKVHSSKYPAEHALKPLSFSPSHFIVGQVCSFLVRPSDNTPGDYSLFFRTNESIQRFKISPTPNNQYMMGGRYYNRYVWQCAVITSESYKEKLYADCSIFEDVASLYCVFWLTVTDVLHLVCSHWQCWWHYRPLQERADCRRLQPQRASFSAGRYKCILALLSLFEVKFLTSWDDIWQFKGFDET